MGEEEEEEERDETDRAIERLRMRKRGRVDRLTLAGC